MSTHQAKTHLLVVGGTGFIGYHLALAAKKKGWKVTSISLKKPKKYRYIKGINYLKVDISNLKFLSQKLKGSFTYVVNLGGYVDHTTSKIQGYKVTKSHFIGVVNLTKILFKKKIKKFIQIGSSIEYGRTKSPQIENFPCKPVSYYGLAKLASTQFLLMLFKREKFPVTILRFFQVYGPKQDQNRFLPQIIRGCINNKKFPVSEGNQIRDFCYIDDVVQAIFLALKSKKSNGEIFNIGSGNPLKIKKAINIIKKKIGKGHPEFGKLKYRKNESMKLYPNIKKAKIKLKWKPKFSFDDGIRNVIQTFI